VVLWFAPARAHESVTITQCGETVAQDTTAFLLKDLDCRGSGTAGVILSHRSRLVLGGHEIVGDPHETGTGGEALQGVRCETGSVCTVEGPGAITGFSASGVAGTRVRVRDVWIADNARAGIAAFENVRVRNAIVTHNGTLAIHAGGHVRATDAELGEEAEGQVVEWGAPRFRPGAGGS
jgi:hypothetical protein